MKNKIKTGLAALAFLPILISASAAANFMPSGARTTQPIGHYEFCRANPNDCRDKTSDPAMVQLSRVLWSEMQEINGTINAGSGLIDLNANNDGSGAQSLTIGETAVLTTMNATPGAIEATAESMYR